jgi:hypothetical protein
VGAVLLFLQFLNRIGKDILFLRSGGMIKEKE